MDFLIKRKGRRMRIGIDIDNTITNTLPILKKYCQKYNEEVVKRDLKINEQGFASYNLYDWTEEENLDFCQKYLEEIVMQAKVKERAKEIIQKLKQEGNIIYIITARTNAHFKNPYETTEKFLREHDIVYDRLIVNCTNKAQVCVENNIEVMIEDETHNIEKISTQIPVIAFQEIYNKRCEGKNIIKVNHWNEIYHIIKNIKKGR